MPHRWKRCAYCGLFATSLYRHNAPSGTWWLCLSCFRRFEDNEDAYDPINDFPDLRALPAHWREKEIHAQRMERERQEAELDAATEKAADDQRAIDEVAESPEEAAAHRDALLEDDDDPSGHEWEGAEP